MKTLPSKYSAKEAEKRWQLHWEEQRVFAWNKEEPCGANYVIDTPPPTVSGLLHMGHIFSYTQADFVARYQRMKGKNVFYPMGFDDNGLPTERLVEKIIKKRATDMPREEFIAQCQKVVKEAEDEFRALFKSVALSVDWEQEYQTISEESRKLSQMSFLDLVRKGEAYRDFRPTYWDWVDQTAIAQAEIENKEMAGVMNEIEFTLEDGTPLVIATTRPELLGACVAVMYHPDDPNAPKYKGKKAITPLFGVKVPMIADELVEREKGTGLVMCCTFGDDTDKEWWRKYKLPLHSILEKDGKINFHFHETYEDEEACEAGRAPIERYIGFDDGRIDESNCIDLDKAVAAFEQIKGLKPKQANARMLELLQAEGVLLKQTPITHSVKCAERSGTPIEILTTEQWFVRIVDKKDALKARGAECKWYPEFMKLRLDQWIDGLKEDWCISRQRYFGVPFPVWYISKYIEDNTGAQIIMDRETGHGYPVVAELESLPVDPLSNVPDGLEITDKLDQLNNQPVYKATKDIYDITGNLIVKKDEMAVFWPDFDIMDTWATSSISPQLSSKGIATKPSPSGRGWGEGYLRNAPLPPEFLSRTRELRAQATDAEQYMWSVLRDRQLAGFKFRRQHPIPPYVVDFFCHEANLVIEVDGGQHGQDAERKKDAARTAQLESKGLKVLRFWNHEVLGNMEGVFQVISDALPHDSFPHPGPLPEGEGEKGKPSPSGRETATKPSPSGRGWGEGEGAFVLDPDRHAKLFPADLRPQAHEIIRTWAFYTIVKAHLHEDTIPWKNLMISGWCLAPDKTKMSKSKGNVITPVGLIEEHSADAVRYWASTSRLGADTAFSEDVLKIGKKLVTKLWNAANFTSLHLQKLETAPVSAAEDVKNGVITEAIDLWLISRLHQAIAKATEEFEAYEYCDARVAAEEFFWKDFCDNYLEIVKNRAYNEDNQNAKGQRSAIHTLYHALEAVLRLFAPFVPHVAEELYSHLFDDRYGRAGSIHGRGVWPDAKLYPQDDAALKAGEIFIDILDAVRKLKATRNLSVKWPIDVLYIQVKQEWSGWQGILEDLKHVTNAARITFDAAPAGSETTGTESGAFTVSALFAAEPDKKQAALS